MRDHHTCVRLWRSGGSVRGVRWHVEATPTARVRTRLVVLADGPVPVEGEQVIRYRTSHADSGVVGTRGEVARHLEARHQTERVG